MLFAQISALSLHWLTSIIDPLTTHRNFLVAQIIYLSGVCITIHWANESRKCPPEYHPTSVRTLIQAHLQRKGIMSFVTTISNYCILECDRFGCNNKMEHPDQKTLKKLASWCGWDRRGDEWLCPKCVEEIGSTKHLRKGSRKVPNAA